MFGCDRTAAFVLLASLSGFSGAVARAETEGRSNSGIVGPPYGEIYEAMAALARANPGRADVFDYGRSHQGRPLRLIRLQDPAKTEMRPRAAVLITGATHGNEYLHVEDRLPAQFLKAESDGVQRFLAQGGLVYIVPIVNPDGYETGRRENGRGIDLNRDFDLVPAKELRFRESETRALASYLEKEFAEQNVRLKLSVDYHCCDGSILYPWAYTDAAISNDDLEAHEQIAKLMLADIDPSYRYGPTGPVLGYNPRGTSKDYYYARYGALAFTFEGTHREEDKKFQGHALFWNHMMAQLAGGT